MAHSLGTGLSGLAKPGKAAPKGTASMTIEPMKPSVPKSEVIAPPKKPGMPSVGITPLQKAGSGWKAKPAIGSPNDVPAPKVVSRA